MPALRYRIINVFAESPLAGNPLCVFEDGSSLDTASMQALALQFNLSETTFILPPTAGGATARVRIFTPGFEMPFAGHPTLGTAHVVRALMNAGDQVTLEMQAGIIPVSARGDEWTLKANAPRTHVPHASRHEFAQMLGLDTSEVLDGSLWVDTGSEQLIMPLASAGAVERCQPNAGLLMKYSVGNKRKGLVYVWACSDESTVRARFFFTKHASLVEDPGTGSACANLGGWFLAHGKPLPVDVKVLQGDQIGRPCRLGLRVDTDNNIFVSGRVVALGGGEITL
jgi:PhzF family phenazine biosynthesis protein